MAWRIEQAVVRGEIDNTVEGLTTGRIWLAGCEAPLELKLEGDCWRDLAGTRLEFVNPNPEPCAETCGLAVNQTGVVGDMTADALVIEDAVEQSNPSARLDARVSWCH